MSLVAESVILIALVLLPLWLLVRVSLMRVTILEHERGLLYENGRFREVLGPGTRWHLRHRTVIQKVDVRTRFVSIPGQEVLSADSVAIKISLAAKFEVTDPALAINRVENYQEALYLELQLALRETVGATSIDDLLARRQEIGKKLLTMAEDKMRAFGVRLISVDVKDVMFPGEIKKILAQVVQAQKQGLAALEKARGETAALRNLANAARMVEGNPALLQLRLLQAVGESSGHTLIWNLAGRPDELPLRPHPRGGEAVTPEPSA